MAACADLREFRRALDAIDAAASGAGLAPYRLHWNGEEADSGGGGQITFGGPCPADSPFLRRLMLLPRLLSYAQRHPSLSYALASDRVGSGSQSPRADEADADALDELELSLHGLARAAELDPPALHAALAPFLADRFGSPHRAEINVEKLSNADYPGRGQLGLVEFRALRMPPTPAHLCAHAALLRAVVARLLNDADADLSLARWGAELHGRYALPYFLERDLEAVLGDLDAHGFGLAPALGALLRDDSHRLLGRVRLPGVELSLRQALEFHPLVGDLSEQQRTSRLIDASTRRIEVRLTGEHAPLCQLVACGHRVPILVDGDCAVMGIRYRAFVPQTGLHPWLGARDPVELGVLDPVARTAHVVRYYQWRTDGEAYAALPASRQEAAARRRERLLLREQDPATFDQLPQAPAVALRPACVDTRYF
jgi:uncharacterized protein (DUF2126 family)